MKTVEAYQVLNEYRNPLEDPDYHNMAIFDCRESAKEWIEYIGDDKATIRSVKVIIEENMGKWETIKDDKIRHIWECENNKCDSVYIEPSWYADNGTPICNCGDDMIYSHTEIKITDN